MKAVCDESSPKPGYLGRNLARGGTRQVGLRRTGDVARGERGIGGGAVMDKQDAEEYVRSCGENDGPDGDEELLTELFVAIYDREPDQEDWDAGVWSLVCAGVD